MAELVQLSDATFESEVGASKGLYLVDFWAAWCGPCRMMEPVLKKVAAEKTDIVIGQLNVDQNPVTAQKFDVMSIPTFVLFKDGQVLKRFTGAMPKPALLAELASA